jgi:hypothetical protein
MPGKGKTKRMTGSPGGDFLGSPRPKRLQLRYSNPQEEESDRKRKKRRGMPFKPIPAVRDFTAILQRARENALSPWETSVRTMLLDSFLMGSHGDLPSFSGLHLQALEKDPLFYGHLARWYWETGSVRDHTELFTAHLLTSPFSAHRDQGIVMMQTLRPYQVARIIRYCKEVLHYPTRALKTGVRFYLKRREAQPMWFDEHYMRDGKTMKYLYATLHIKPGDRAEKILFRDEIPPDSRIAAFKKLSRLAGNPAEQARLILAHRLPCQTSMGAIRHFTPAVLYALTFVMTPPQLINNLKFLEKHNALQDPETRKVVEEKLRHGISESRVSDFKTLAALSRINADGGMAEKLMEMTNSRLRNRGRITVPTALFIDKSGSMQECIEIGKLLAATCSAITSSELFVYAFDGNAFEITSRGSDFASWEKAFSMIRADGCTSIGAPFKKMMGKRVSQVLVISDGDENTRPLFREMLDLYEQESMQQCRVIFLKVQNSRITTFESSMKGKDFTVINFNGDYYSLPNVVPMLCGGSGHDLVNDIMDMPLLDRSGLQSLPRGFNEETCEIL